MRRMTLVRELAETQVVRRLHEARVVAIAALTGADDAESAGAALMRGGIGCLEIDGPPSAIRAARRVEGLLVGAGGVLDPGQAEHAARAGAQFATAPGTNMAVVHACRELELPFLPGVATPSEIERLYSLGLTVLRVFPAAAVGGPGFLEAVAGAYPGVRFVPSGGIGPETLRNYLAVPAVLAVGAGWLVRPEHVRSRSFERIEWLAREASRANVYRRS
jgi:2-dehydro-3-deoxyphosphogluconate aldolase/(4S)-4-hydroxy-2-oxoglutarate aldolase